MNLRLVVLTPGAHRGQVIPVARSPFLVGRAAHCQLRPASPLVGPVHCALAAGDHRAFVCDRQGSSGTLLNGRRVRGQAELYDQDELHVGPLAFRVRLEASTPGGRTTPPPARRADANASLEDAVAAMLLAIPEGDGAAPGGEGTPGGADAPKLPPPGAVTGGKRRATPGGAAAVATALVAEYRRQERATAPTRGTTGWG
jgi:predicted component of type VI protein secretion system